MFTTQPQAVEVHQRGEWRPGQLLGWRHDPDGTCQVWVRVVVDDVEESAWTDLTALRLPERHLSVAPEESFESAQVTPASPEARASSTDAGRAGARDPFETASLPLVRDRSVAPTRISGSAPRSGRRGRAPDTATLVALPVPAVPATPASVSSAGAPSAAAPSMGAGFTDTSPAGSAAVDGGLRGRHRAPADPGRHRAADTGLLPVIAAGADAAVASTPLRARVNELLPAPLNVGPACQDAEPDLLTRPMRLADLTSHSRRPRVGGSRTGV
ncbi:MAG: uncharacterized protein JWQ45_1198 [Blastococcus sp.]|nr:uncharacterized protein [Blastococcus sp.]